MNKARQEKERVVQEIKSKLQNSNAAVLTDYRGLNVAEVTELRKQLREAGVEYKVLKNTLVKIAAKEVGLEDLFQYLEGPTAIAFSEEDPVAPAKILSNFAKEHKNLEIKAGLLEGNVVSIEQVKELADLPSREELIAKVLGGLQGPISGLVNVLQGPIRNLVYVLEAIRKEKEAQAS
ncbi:MAG: ribosomal protein [Clostridiales bacterium]|nr:ribosomal protein [Clostridiales bacterium]